MLAPGVDRICMLGMMAVHVGIQQNDASDDIKSRRDRGGRDGKTFSGAESIWRYPRQPRHGHENGNRATDARPFT
ncbi:hypothetical protein PT2222_20444 [Paraburkholderia tropica]